MSVLQRHLPGVQRTLLLFRDSGVRDVFLLGLPFLLSNEGETHCEDDVYRLSELENILVAPFNSTCALNSGLKEGCATQSKERSCS